MGFKVAVVGATGNVGREMLDILAERRFPADEVVALASRKSHGHRGLVRRQDAEVQGARAHYDFSDVDICLMSAGGDGLEGMVAEDRRAGRRGDRQLVGVALWTRTCR